jgi:three-Cys-motif partner protein
MPKVDLSNYEGREQAYVKHRLLEEYLSRWAYKIGSSWDPLVFVDGFAGPWGAKDQEFADASFGIAIKALNEAVEGLFRKLHRTVRGVCVFVEKEPKPFAKLDALYAQAMALPVVTPNDLQSLLSYHSSHISNFSLTASVEGYRRLSKTIT